MGCFGPIAAPLIYRVKLPSHCTVCYTVLFLSYNPLKYIDFLTATNSSKAKEARSNRAGQAKYFWLGL